VDERSSQSSRPNCERSPSSDIAAARAFSSANKDERRAFAEQPVLLGFQEPRTKHRAELTTPNSRPFATSWW